MPAQSVRLGVLLAEDELVTGGTSGPDLLGIMPLAVGLALEPEVDEICQRVLASGAGEARRMPAVGQSHLGGGGGGGDGIDLIRGNADGNLPLQHISSAASAQPTVATSAEARCSRHGGGR